MNIKLQSAIDVITNSSTSIYTTAGNWTLTGIKEIIDLTLNIADSNLKADDLFIFEIDKPSYWDDDYFFDKCIMYIDEILDEEEYNRVQNLPYEEMIQYYEDVITDEIKEKVSVKHENDRRYNGDYWSQGVKITPKNDSIVEHQKLAKILSNLENLFNYKASYD